MRLSAGVPVCLNRQAPCCPATARRPAALPAWLGLNAYPPTARQQATRVQLEPGYSAGSPLLINRRHEPVPWFDERFRR